MRLGGGARGYRIEAWKQGRRVLFDAGFDAGFGAGLDAGLDGGGRAVETE